MTENVAVDFLPLLMYKEQVYVPAISLLVTYII